MQVTPKKGGSIRTAPGLSLVFFLIVCAVTAITAYRTAPDFAASVDWKEIVILQQASPTPSQDLFTVSFPFIQRHAILLLALSLPIIVFATLRCRGISKMAPITAGAIATFIVWYAGESFAANATPDTSFMGAVATPTSNLIFRIIIGSALLSPPLLVWLYYKRATTLDRYVVKSFLAPFLLCLIGFIVIWFIMDLADNGPDFTSANPPPTIATLAEFYISRVPQIIVLILDVTLLLAFLYTLGKMSQTNEIISMLGAGLSTWRILLPLFVIAFYASVLSLALNYRWAPQAERKTDDMLEALDEEKYQRKTAANNVFYVNRIDNRNWFVGTIPIDLTSNKLRYVEIHQQDGSGQVARMWSAKSARWFPTNIPGSDIPGEWLLFEVRSQNYDKSGIPIAETIRDDKELRIKDWAESPSKLQSGNLNPEYLGVSELQSYISTNADLPGTKLAPFRTQLANRFALPWRCFIIALIAAPLGIVFSRRGLLGGVASCVFIYFMIYFISAVSLAFGDSQRLLPAFAAWTTNLIFAGIGVVLLFFRASNRELPKLSISSLFKKPIA
ncbi:MAG: LptF/LptG family permease [Verrucomicrobiales bacterium]|nr:LptF/LptG family permease [Verrucomicrobiales bacterium]